MAVAAGSAVIGGSILKGVSGSRAANSARDAQLDAANRANTNAQNWIDTSRGLYDPYMQQGQAAGQTIQSLMNNPQFWGGYGGFQSTAGQAMAGMPRPTQPQPQQTATLNPATTNLAGGFGPNGGLADLLRGMASGKSQAQPSPAVDDGGMGGNRNPMPLEGPAQGPDPNSGFGMRAGVPPPTGTVPRSEQPYQQTQPGGGAPTLSTLGYGRGQVGPTLSTMQSSGAMSGLAQPYQQQQAMQSTAGNMQANNLAGSMQAGSGLGQAGAIQPGRQVGQTRMLGGALNSQTPQFQAGMSAGDTSIPQGGYQFNTPGDVAAPQLATNAGTNKVGASLQGQIPGATPFQLGQAPSPSNIQAPGVDTGGFQQESIREMLQRDEGYKFAQEEAAGAAGQMMAAAGLRGSGAEAAARMRGAADVASRFAGDAYSRQANEKQFLANRADTGFSQGMQGAQFGLGQQGQNYSQWAQSQGLGLQAAGQNQQLGLGLADRELARTQYNAGRDDTAFGQQMSQAQFGAGRTDQAMQNWLSQQGLGLQQTQANRGYENQLQQNELSRLGFSANRQDQTFNQSLAENQFNAGRQDASNADYLNRYQAGQGDLAANRGWDLNNRQFDLSRLGYNAGRQDTAFGQGLQQDQFNLGAQNQAFGQNFQQQQFGANREDQRFNQALQGDQFGANRQDSLFNQLSQGWNQGAQTDQFAANRQDQAMQNWLSQQNLGLQQGQFGLQQNQFNRNNTIQDRDYDMQLRNQMLSALGSQQGMGFNATGQFANIGSQMNGAIQQNYLGQGNAQAASAMAQGQAWGTLGGTMSSLGGAYLGGDLPKIP